MQIFKKSKEVSIDPNVLNNAKVSILENLNSVCEKLDIKYFIFGQLLIQCVHYGNVDLDEDIPWDIALLRNEYDKLISYLRQNAADYGLFLNDYYKNTTYPNELISLGKECIAHSGDIQIRQIAWIYISPFEKLPEDFDVFCGFNREMRRINRYYHKILIHFSAKKNSFYSLLLKLYYHGDTPDKAYRRRELIASRYMKSSSQLYGRVISKKTETITKEQLYPLKSYDLYNMKVPGPNDYSPWTAVMNDALVKQIKEIQQIDLFVLREFDRVCRILNIGYFICGGTMLGWKRHNGFIPWDDDIDVGMLRKDYDIFIREGGKYLDQRCFLQTRASDPQIPYLFSKVRVNNTEYITEYNENRNFHKGICLDLFPFDVLPQDSKTCDRFLRKVNRLVKIHNQFSNKQLPEPQRQFSPRSTKEYWFKFIGKAQRKIYKLVPLSFTQKLYIRTATKYNQELESSGNCTVASFVPTYTYIKIDDLLPYQNSVFEGVGVMVPKKPEVFLKMQYGDYMKLPPKHKQAGHELLRYSIRTDILNSEVKK